MISKKVIGAPAFAASHSARRAASSGSPIVSPATNENAGYLETKRAKLGHLRAI